MMIMYSIYNIMMIKKSRHQTVHVLRCLRDQFRGGLIAQYAFQQRPDLGLLCLIRKGGLPTF